MGAPTTSLRDQVGHLLRDLRGSTSRAAASRHLGIARSGVVQVEEGKLSLDRLDEIGGLYGVRFVVSAVDPVTREPVTTAPALVGLEVEP